MFSAQFAVLSFVSGKNLFFLSGGCCVFKSNNFSFKL